MQQKLEAVEVALSRGLKELNWRSPDIAFYINESMDLVKVRRFRGTSVRVPFHFPSGFHSLGVPSHFFPSESWHLYLLTYPSTLTPPCPCTPWI